MNLSSTTCDALARCVDYPRADLSEHAGATAARLRRDIDDSVALTAMIDALASLEKWSRSVGVAAAQERYTQLFDLKPVATLNVSHHILGDTYQRGALLAGLAAELNKAGIPHGHDLPDFLPTLLRLVGRMT
ncbi:MAG: molecular chaperone TorD family protein, partial [Myxococcota bacterium]